MAQSVARDTDSTRRATYQGVLDAPAHRVAEIIDETLHTLEAFELHYGQWPLSRMRRTTRHRYDQR